MKYLHKRAGSLAVAAVLVMVGSTGLALAKGNPPYHPPGFQRIATFPVFLNTDVDSETVAEIIATTKDGKLLVYTDSETENIGFVDIGNPYNPTADGVVAVDGEPTSVAVLDRHFRKYALAAVNTSEDFTNPSGLLQVIDIRTRQIVRSIDLGGQPDSVAVSPSGRYAAIAIENERDEDLGDGAPPQAPPGFVVILDLVGPPDNWSTRKVDLVGVPDLFPSDPEPEFIDISVNNVAAVTLQENNAVVLIHLRDGKVIHQFSTGETDLDHVDVQENDLIEQVDSLEDIAREPDAVAWTSPLTLATADEGDLFGGSRGFTVWSAWGDPLFEAGNTVEHVVARLGHYPENRSENKGNEPEGVKYARYGRDRLLFVGSERSNVVLVYELSRFGYRWNRSPRLVQVLPAGVGPEGLLAIPKRNLFVVANEVDDRDAKIRSTIMIYRRSGKVTYPTIVSENRLGEDVPIPWAALSGLAADPDNRNFVYTVHDGFYRKSRIYTMIVDDKPARIFEELEIVDAHKVLRTALEGLKDQLFEAEDFEPQTLINEDHTVNLDPEGIAAADGYFYIASEGAGNLVSGVSSPDNRPFESPNVIVQVDENGVIQQAILLPLELTQNQFRFGFEGVAAVGDYLYVAFQRAWENAGDPADRARIGRYDSNTGEWSFAYYPLDEPTSPHGGWVGLSELTYVGSGKFAVIERDNQGGPDARVKRIYTFSADGVVFKENNAAPGFDVVNKTLALDLIAAGTYDVTGGLFPEKLEGFTVLNNGTSLIVNDNDGVDDNSGETQLLRIKDVFDSHADVNGKDKN